MCCIGLVDFEVDAFASFIERFILSDVFEIVLRWLITLQQALFSVDTCNSFP
jgi:hypothetical protein